jgi:proline iminopeptidase
MPRTSAGVVAAILLTLLTTGCRPQHGTGAQPTAGGLETGVIKVGGVALPYITEGSGLPCLIYGNRLFYSRAFSPRFKSSLRCTFVDSRVFVTDASVSAAVPFTVDAAVEEVEAVRRFLGQPKIILVGGSIFGTVALAYAQRFPDNVSHVIAFGCTPEVSDESRKASEAYWEEDAVVLRKGTYVKNWADLTHEALLQRDPFEAFVDSVVADAPKRIYNFTYREQWLLAGCEVNRPLMRQLFGGTYSLRKDSRKIRPPVLLITGRYDYLSSPTQWKDFQDLFLDLTYKPFDLCGQNPEIEMVDAFDRQTLTWLRR